jgi:prevent-host-death family protein
MVRKSKHPKRKRYDSPKGRVAKVSELKAGLSAYLAQVKRGDEVVVTERGEPIARIVPIESIGARSDHWARVRQMQREGRVIVRGDGRVPERYWTLQVPDLPPGSVVRALLEDRDESW